MLRGSGPGNLCRQPESQLASAVSRLHLRFPKYPDSIIQDILEQLELDKEAAAQHLADMSGDGVSRSPEMLQSSEYSLCFKENEPDSHNYQVEQLLPSAAGWEQLDPALQSCQEGCVQEGYCTGRCPPAWQKPVAQRAFCTLPDSMIASALQQSGDHINKASDKCLAEWQSEKDATEPDWSDSSPESDYDSSSVAAESLPEVELPSRAPKSRFYRPDCPQVRFQAGIFDACYTLQIEC